MLIPHGISDNNLTIDHTTREELAVGRPVHVHDLLGHLLLAELVFATPALGVVQYLQLVDAG